MPDTKEALSADLGRVQTELDQAHAVIRGLVEWYDANDGITGTETMARWEAAKAILKS